MWKLVFSFLCLVCICSTGRGQTKKESFNRHFYPTNLWLGTDIVPYINSLTSSHVTAWEIYASTNIWRYQLCADYGYQNQHKTLSQSIHDAYQNSGQYLRVGVDINLLLKKVNQNMLFIGFRYGISEYKESLTVKQSNPYYGTKTTTFLNPNLSARWGEIVAGLRAKIWHEFWIGYTIRFKFARSSSGEYTFTPHNIPGYGRHYAPTYWGINYQLFYRIPWKKTKGSQARTD